ncbi:MAG: YlxR family protein [Ruminococcaceae bacterium]|nr:YlxR family protein [Oscillospiraceae bacterium]
MPKKIPMRQCVACREKKEKFALARVVRTPDGRVLYDARGKVSGRGAYICRDLKCLEKAVKSRALARALECEIPDEAFEELRAQFLKEEQEAQDGQQ